MMFLTSALGDVDRVTMPLDGEQAIFVRVTDAPAIEILKRLAGTYEAEMGPKWTVVLDKNNALALHLPGGIAETLLPLKDLKFRARKWPRVTFEFIFDNERVTGVRHWDSFAEFHLKRVEIE
jgi:hypothetical protein